MRKKNVESLEEGIIVFATIVRGLKYRHTEISEDGHKIIILADLNLDNTLSKTL